MYEQAFVVLADAVEERIIRQYEVKSVSTLKTMYERM